MTLIDADLKIYFLIFNESLYRLSTSMRIKLVLYLKLVLNLALYVFLNLKVYLKTKCKFNNFCYARLTNIYFDINFYGFS